MPIPNFIKKDGDSVYYNGEGRFIFFVPESYFSRKCATIEGEYVEMIGILNYCISKNEEDNDYSKKLKTFNFPSRFMTKPGRIEKVKNLQLSPESKVEDYRLLIYTDNMSDQIIVSTKVPQDIANVEDFFRLFVLTGNIPKTIPYDKLHEYFLESIELNGSSYKISAQMFGIIVSEICRSSSDLNKPFRLANTDNMYDYIPMKISSVPKLNGPYNSITSENWDESLVGAIMNKETKNSPLEKIIMSR